jgi:hypothetical protein
MLTKIAHKSLPLAAPLLWLALVRPSGAIIGGELDDGNLFPNQGTVMLDYGEIGYVSYCAWISRRDLSSAGRGGTALG